MVRAIVIFLINASPSRVWNQKTLSGSQTSTEETHLFCYSMQIYISSVTLSPDHSQILSSSHGEKSGEGLGSKLRHRPEMVDSVSTNQVHVTYKPSPPFPVRDVVNSTLVISG